MPDTVDVEWLALLMLNVNRVHGDGLPPIRSLSEVTAHYADGWIDDARDVLNGTSPLAPAMDRADDRV